MNDVINRQAAIQAINDLPDCPNGYSDTYDKETIINVLNDIPTTKAKWIHDGSIWKYRFLCSNCNYKIYCPKTNFCPNCGATMDNKEEEK